MSKNVLTMNDPAEIITEILPPDPGHPTRPQAVEEGDSYGIIGTRFPDENQREAAKILAFLIACLRRKKVCTGGASGIDEAVMEGCRGTNLEVYLPWDSYNRDIIPSSAARIVYNAALPEHCPWTESVSLYHPAHLHLSRGAFALHARNYGIVFGRTAVIAFPDSKGEGGTAQGIRISRALHIPVIQANKNTITDLPRWLGKTIQILGFSDKSLAITLPGGRL